MKRTNKYTTKRTFTLLQTDAQAYAHAHTIQKKKTEKCTYWSRCRNAWGHFQSQRLSRAPNRKKKKKTYINTCSYMQQISFLVSMSVSVCTWLCACMCIFVYLCVREPPICGQLIAAPGLGLLRITLHLHWSKPKKRKRKKQIKLNEPFASS